MPPLGVVIGITWLAVAMMFRISSLAALASVTLAPVLALVGGYSTAEIVCLVALAVLIFWRHAANIARLRAGTEPRMGDKKATEEEPALAPATPTPAPVVVAEVAPAPAPEVAPETSLPAEPKPEA
jgi:hypothetical protein